ncbi:BZ3500_MvSof-1268-A1-R1_Chr1-3g01546 [Microbotryum saponariae]|uniref:BZ3500_MvSof-1268-A1-R1_Chr1-3g01546 protein n=1 Tax=Microbotryum saponariae TaxID=289078 RepID=A0A2X0KG22_9BASI|nr:BZ3500_MvSof-1268-A1-R1_Chr1-3g01546 [Microbotryum saponariae]SCZ93997.1 BZ3501_MvSof-1269-A2-R1_Chr1-3g01148 [Microbotryum saponariae]
MQAKHQAIMSSNYECKLKDTRQIIELPLYIDTEVYDRKIYYNARPKDKDIERECSSHLKIMIPASNVSVTLIYRLGDHEGRVTLESVRKPATVMWTIARQIKVLSDYCKKWEKIHRVTRHPNRAIWAKQIKRRAYVLDVVIHTRLRCDMEESLLELEVKPLGSSKVEIFVPTPILIDPSIGTMDTTHSNFDPQRTTPLVSRNPQNSPAPSSATIGLMPATPRMRLQRVDFFYFTGAHKLQSFGLAGTATKRAKRGYKATTASNWVKVKPLRAKSAAQIKTRRAPNADSNGR